jgi:hypothetical protein
MKLKLIIILLIVISSLIIGCVELPKSTTSKNIIPETISDISIKIFDNCGTTIQCDNWIETHINGKYVRWNGIVSDARDNMLIVSTEHIIPKSQSMFGKEKKEQATIYLHGLSEEDLLKFKSGDMIQFIGKINIEKNSYGSQLTWFNMISPSGAIKLELYDVTIEQPNVSN